MGGGGLAQLELTDALYVTLPPALWNPVIKLLHLSSPIAKFVECSYEEIAQANAQ